MRAYRTILFDADNTLFDFSRAEREAIADTMRFSGITPTEALIGSYSEINDAMWKRLERGEISKESLREARFFEFCRTFGFEIDVPRMASAYVTFLSQKTHLIDGALAVCEALAEKYSLYIVTNGIKTVQRKRFAASRLTPFFSDIFISEELGFEKPHRGFFDAVAARIPDFSPSAALIVGDSLSSDVRGGIAAGLDTCWYNPRGIKNGEALPITYEIRTLKDLVPLLLS